MAGHWSRECPLTTGLSAEVQQSGGTIRKISVNLSDFEYTDEDVGSFPSEVGEDSELECLHNVILPLLEGGEFLQDDTIHVRVGGRNGEHISSWEALQPPEHVLKILRQGYILPFTSLPKPVFIYYYVFSEVTPMGNPNICV